MRMLILFALGLAGVAAALLVSPGLRTRAENVLFRKPELAEQTEGAPAEQAPADAGAQHVLEALSEAGREAAEAVVEVAAKTTLATPAPAEPAENDAEQQTPRADAAAEPTEPEEPQRQAPPQRTAQQRIELPRFLRYVRFGMSPGQVSQSFSIAWQKDEGDDVTLSHYPLPDKSQMAQFQFRGDSLYLIRIALKPAEGQTLKQLYDGHQRSFAERYANVKEARRTRWSDGTVQASIGIDKKLNCVEITYSASSFRR